MYHDRLLENKPVPDISSIVPETTDEVLVVRELPRGRHRLARETVIASQRARMLDAMAQCVAAKGYAVTTVADVVSLATVSRRTFYEQFRDKEVCFLAALDEGLQFLLLTIRDALAAHPHADWRSRVRLSIEAYLSGLAAKPTFARAFLIEAIAVGPQIFERRDAVFSRWVDQWRALEKIARSEGASIPEISNEQMLVLVAGIEELVRKCLRTRGAEHLRDLVEPATAVALTMLGGAAK